MLQSVATGADAAEDAAEGEANDAYGALYKAIFGRGESESSLGCSIDEEKGADLGQQAFGHAVEEHEADACPYLGLLEEGLQRVPELLHDGGRWNTGGCPWVLRFAMRTL